MNEVMVWCEILANKHFEFLSNIVSVLDQTMLLYLWLHFVRIANQISITHAYSIIGIIILTRYFHSCLLGLLPVLCADRRHRLAISSAHRDPFHARRRHATSIYWTRKNFRVVIICFVSIASKKLNIEGMLLFVLNCVLRVKRLRWIVGHDISGDFNYRVFIYPE